MSFKTKSINLSHGEISYIENSTEGTPALFVHGNNSAKESFERQFQDETLASYHLLALDLPGHGASARKTNYSLEDFVLCLVEFCQKLKLSRPVLVGHSLGGNLSIRASQKMELAGLVLSQTPPLNTLEDFFKGHYPLQDLNCLFQKQLAVAEKRMVAKIFANEALLQSKIEDWLGVCDPHFRDSFQAALNTYPFGEADIVRNLKIPFAFIGTSGDKLINCAYIKNVVGEENYFEIDGTCHYPHFEQSGAFNRQLKIFLEGL